MRQSKDYTETFIFNVNYRTVKVVLNMTKHKLTVYSAANRIIIKREHVTMAELNDMKKELNEFIKKKKDIGEFKSRLGASYL